MKRLPFFCSLVAFITMVAPAGAHGPTLKVDRTAVPAGAALTVRGEGLASNGEIRLTLQGVLQDYDLGAVQGDEHGRFESTLSLPADLSPGDYTLIASGEKTATAKLTVVKPSDATGTTEPPPQEHAGHQGAEAPADTTGHATPEPMEIERSTRGAARALAWVATLGSGLLGIALLVRYGHR